jgi:hypothetical protein
LVMLGSAQVVTPLMCKCSHFLMVGNGVHLTILSILSVQSLPIYLAKCMPSPSTQRVAEMALFREQFAAESYSLAGQLVKNCRRSSWGGCAFLATGWSNRYTKPSRAWPGRHSYLEEFRPALG